MDVIRRYFTVIAVVWSLFVTGLFVWGLIQADERTDAILLSQARPFLDQIIITRSWNARHGGVYVPVSKENPPNPYLNTPLRDVETTDGLKLTLINPAYMTRQLSELALKESGLTFHLTSEHPIRPANAAKSWELDALKQFHKPEDAYFKRWENGEGEHFLRYMEPVWLGSECLQCHASQGGEGALSGGLSVTIPADEVVGREHASVMFQAVAYALIWLLGVIGLALAFREIRKRAFEQEELIERLEHTLQGLVPICSSCKSIRTEAGEWEQLECYISSHSEAEFSHGICPSCAKSLYGDFLRSKD